MRAEKSKYYYLLIPLVLVSVLAFNYLFDIYLQRLAVRSEPLIKRLEKLYRADPLSLFDELDDPLVYKKKIKIEQEIRNAIVLPPPKSIAKKVNVPPGSVLRFGFGVWEASYPGEGDGCSLNVYIVDGQQRKKVFSKYIDPKRNADERRWFDAEIDLSDYKNKEVTIVFETKGSKDPDPSIAGGADNRDDYPVISDPEIISKPRVSDMPNIILISIDTLRADHLGCYGYKREGISANIDNLAGKGILFENAVTPSPWTIPAHMSLFTSLLPSYHRMMNDFSETGQFRIPILSDKIVTLAQALRRGGYKTTAFSSGAWLSGEFGFSRGFDVYREYSFTNDTSYKKLKEWLNKTETSFFLFLHTYKVHAPYTDLTYAGEVMPEKEVDSLRQYIEKATESNDRNIFEGVIQYKKRLQEANLYKKEITEALYDGGIYETDKYIGKLMSELEELKLLRNSIIILTSDHGEEFGDHTPYYFYDEHGHSLYDELLRVPLIMVMPGNFPKGARIKSQVRLIDIMPTLLDITNSAHGDGKMQGASLLPMIKGESPEGGLPAISEALIYKTEKKSIRTDKFKYIYTIALEEVGKKGRIMVTENPAIEELYNLENDPEEKNNLYSFNVELCNKLKKWINKTLLKAVADMKSRPDTKVEIDEKTKRQLEALGYVQ